MDFRLESKDDKEVVVIRSSSCVIKIRETSSVFKSCHSDTSSTSVSQETRIFQVKPDRRVGKYETRSARHTSYSEEDAVVERSPACTSWARKNDTSQEGDASPQKIPSRVMKLIEPSEREVVPAHSSHCMNGYEMLEVLIKVLNELKSDCGAIFSKRETCGSRQENALKLLIRDCFTELMVRYSTEPSDSSRGHYNRCQKIISRSIKNLTLECVDIIERAICRQAKVMPHNRRGREDAKSLLTKIMQIIQRELNRSKPVLKVVNTELHQPSFQFIFSLLKYFIEKSALGIKSLCQESTSEVPSGSRRVEGAGEFSDNSCDVSISLADQKLDEYSSRLDRLLEKVSSKPPIQENPPLLIDCFHCTTKCKEQDLLLKTVTRFTEEIKQELINHARIVHDGSQYSYIGQLKGRNSKDISLCSPEVSTKQSHARCTSTELPHGRGNSSSPNCSPMRSSQATHAVGTNIANRTAQNHPSSSEARQNSKTHCSANKGQTGIRVKEYKACVHHAQKRDMPNIEVKPHASSEHPNVKSRPASPTCLHKHDVGVFECSKTLKSKSVPQNRKYDCPSPPGNTGTQHQFVTKCRYCTSQMPNHKPCVYDNVEENGKNGFRRGPPEIFVSEPSSDQLPKPPTFEKNLIPTIPESNEFLNLKIFRKEEQGLVKKSKPAIDESSKKNEKSKQEEKVLLDVSSGNGNKPIGDQGAMIQTNVDTKGKSPDKNDSKKSGTTKKEKPKSKSPESTRNEKKDSLINVDPVPPSSGTKKEPEQVTANLEIKKDNETLLQAHNTTMDDGRSKAKDPAHCCRMNCNCRNRRGETQVNNSENPISRRDSMNQTDQEPRSQHASCCKGCNCGQGPTPVFMQGCNCKTGGAQDGDMASRPIYQFFATPIPVPCNCKETPNKDQKGAQTSKPTTPKSDRRVSQETGTQTSKNNLNKMPSESDPSSYPASSSAPSKSDPSSSAPANYTSSSGPTGYSTTSSSEPTYLKSSTSQPTSSTASRVGKSDSMVSCTCSMDKEPHHHSKSNMKDACTSDTNCCCPEKIEEVFQEFDDKYSEVVKEIKFLIREGHIPLNKKETRELTVTASRSSPKGYTSKTATCRCTQESCKKCRGYPAAAFSRAPQAQSGHPNKVMYDVDKEREEGFHSGKYKYPKNLTYDSSYDDCEEPQPPPQYASKDTYVYNELQRDINDLKELVKNTRFGNCPCCKCCTCEPGNQGKLCPPKTDGTDPQQERASKLTNPCTDPDDGKQKTRNDQPDLKKEPVMGQERGNVPTNKTQDADKKSTKSTALKNEPKKKEDSFKVEKPLEQPVPTKVSEGKGNQEGSEGHLPEGNRQYAGRKLSSELPDGETRSKNGTNNDQSKGSEQATPDSKNLSPLPPNKQDSSPKKPIRADENGAPPSTLTEGSTNASNSMKARSKEALAETPAVGKGQNEGLETDSISIKAKVTDSKEALAGTATMGKGQNEGLVTDSNSIKAKGTDSKEALAGTATMGKGQNEGLVTDSNSNNAKGTHSKEALTRTGTMGKGQNETNPSDSSNKILNASGPPQTASSILKVPSKEKVESKTTLKKVEIDEPAPKPTKAGTSDGISDVQPHMTGEEDFGRMRKSPQVGPEFLPKKTVSNVSFGSKKSALSTTSSKNLVLSPEQEALFQSRERLRDYSSQVFISPADDGQEAGRDERQHAFSEGPGKSPGTIDEGQPGFFRRVFGGSSKTPASSPNTTPTKDNVPSSDDSVGDSSGDSTIDICKTLLDGMEQMPCRFWSTEEATPCLSLDTYVMVLESETSNEQATGDETFIITNDAPTRATNKSKNVYKAQLEKRRELEKSAKGGLVQQTSLFPSKATSTIWKGIASQFSVLKGIYEIPEQPAESTSNELSIEALERELSRKSVQKPSKKLVSPLNVSSHYSHVTYRMTRSRDRKRRSGGDLKAYSSESIRRNSLKPPKTEDKEVQVTKWNAMTQTAGPRKFNRTDISKEIEDKLARYLGLERTVEDTSLSLTLTSNSEDHTVVRGSNNRSRRASKRERNNKQFMPKIRAK